MKHSYEASRVVLGPKPIRTSATRIQNFLALPATGRTLTQLHEDYQEVTANLPGSTFVPYSFKSSYATSYAIGWARHQPEQALEWASTHIAQFETDPKVQTHFLSTWLKLDTETASQWLQTHPEQQALIDDLQKLQIIVPLAILPVQQASQLTSITLPR